MTLLVIYAYFDLKRGQTPLMMSIKGQKIPILQLFLGKHRLLVNEQDNVNSLIFADIH